MHALEVIIAKNAAAQGREAAQAVNDGEHELFDQIHAVSVKELEASDWKHHSKAYFRERKDETASYGLGPRAHV